MRVCVCVCVRVCVCVCVCVKEEGIETIKLKFAHASSVPKDARGRLQAATTHDDLGRFYATQGEDDIAVAKEGKRAYSLTKTELPIKDSMHAHQHRSMPAKSQTRGSTTMKKGRLATKPDHQSSKTGADIGRTHMEQKRPLARHKEAVKNVAEEDAYEKSSTEDSEDDHDNNNNNNNNDDDEEEEEEDINLDEDDIPDLPSERSAQSSNEEEEVVGQEAEKEEEEEENAAEGADFSRNGASSSSSDSDSSAAEDESENVRDNVPHIRSD